MSWSPRSRRFHARVLVGIIGVSLGLLLGGSAALSQPVSQSSPAVTSLQPSARTITQGATSSLTVTISAAQPAETTVAFTSSAPGIASVPDTVTVSAGATSAVVSVAANTPGTAQITASLNGTSVTSAITVTPALPSVVSLLPPTTPMAPGATTTLTVTLSSAQPIDTVVETAASPGGIVSVPSSVMVPAGHTSASLTVTAVAFGTASITARLNGSFAQAAVQVTAPPPAIVSLLPSPLPLVAGATGNLIVVLNAVQGTDIQVSVTADDPSVIQAPAAVTVAAGQTQALFTVTGLAQGTALVTASLGSSTKTSTVQVLNPPPTPVALAPNPFVLQQGGTGLVTLSLNAVQATDTVVPLTASSPSVLQTPPSVTVPAGQLSASFPVTGLEAGRATLSATLNGATVSAAVQITARQPAVLALTPGTLTLVAGTPGVLQAMVSTAPKEPLVVAVTSNLPAIASVPAIVTIPAGALSAEFPVLAGAEGTAIITATLGGSASIATVTVTPSESAAPSLSPTEPAAATPGTSRDSAQPAPLTDSAVVPPQAAGKKGGPPGLSLSGRVLSATDGKPVAGATLMLAGHSTISDANGRFVFATPPGGYQLVVVERNWLDQRAVRVIKVKARAHAPHLHAHPILVNIAPGQAAELPYPMYIYEPNQDAIPIVPGRRAEIRPKHLRNFAIMVPEGTTIRGDDGQANTQVHVTAFPPDRVPPLPQGTRTRTIYLISFEKHGGGTPDKPVPVIAPNDLGAPPGSRVTLWYYDKSPLPDPASHQWKPYGQGTVSADGKQIIPDPGVGQPKFCWIYVEGGAVVGAMNIGAPGSGGLKLDPVDISSGVLVVQKTDMVLPGVLPVSLTRTYRTLTQGGGMYGALGLDSTHNYEHKLAPAGSQALTYLTPDGNTYILSMEADGKYRNGTYPFLRGVAVTPITGGYELRQRDGSVWVFNSGGWLIEQRDRFNNRVVISRPGGHMITEITDPAGRALMVTWTTIPRYPLNLSVITAITDPLGRVVSYGYDGSGRLATVTDPAGGVTRYTYDGNHRLVTITDARGLTYLTNEYDTNGRVVRQTQGDGSVSTLRYTVAGGTITQTDVTDPKWGTTSYRFNSAQYITQVTDAVGQVTNYTLDPGTNQLMQVTDPLNRITSYTYDASGNVTTITDPANHVTQFTYEPTFNRVATITDPLNQVTSFTYDSTGNLLTATDPLNHTTTMTYNVAGQPLTVKDPANITITFAYDEHGNLITTTDPLGNATQRAYDAVSRFLGMVDPRGFNTLFRYDALNQVTQIVDAVSGLTSFSQDQNGNLLSVADAKGQTTAYEYDAMDRVRSRTDALIRNERYEYDLNGNLTKFTDRKQQVTNFLYDALNLRTSVLFADGSSTTFTYDVVSRLTSVIDTIGGTITFAYDTLDRLISTTTPQGTITYTYDVLSRRATMTVNGGTPVTYSYDVASRLIQVAQGSNWVTLAYDAAGRRTTLTYSNGVVATYDYDLASRLLGITHIKEATTIESVSYTYDPAGNRTKLIRSNATGTLLPAAVTTTAYDASNEQIQFNTAAPTYDPNGNLTSDGAITHTWDARNRLVAMTGPGVSASFVYDAFNRRISKTVNGVTTQYLYDGPDIVAELSAGGAVTATYLRGLNIDEPFVRQGTTTEFYHTDALGSTLALTNASGTVSTTYKYEPFGQTTVTGTSSNPFQYTGRENDGTGLYYYRARYYSPTLQRFISEDPLEFDGGDINLYSYAGNNTVNFIDPSGLYSWNEFMKDLTQVADIRAAQNFWQAFKEDSINQGDLVNATIGDIFSGLLEGSGALTVQESSEILGSRKPIKAKLWAGAKIVGVGVAWYGLGTTQVTGRIVGQERTSRLIGLRNRFGEHFYTDQNGFFFALDRAFHRLHIGPWKLWFTK